MNIFSVNDKSHQNAIEWKQQQFVERINDVRMVRQVVRYRARGKRDVGRLRRRRRFKQVVIKLCLMERVFYFLRSSFLLEIIILN